MRAQDLSRDGFRHAAESPVRDPFTGEPVGFAALYDQILAARRGLDWVLAYLLEQAARESGDPWRVEVVYAAASQHLLEVARAEALALEVA